MWLTRRRLFQQLAGRDQADVAGPVIRISLNENPVGPGQHVLDALIGKFHESSRYPFNALQHEGQLPAAIAAKFPGAKAENVVMGAGSGEILTNAVRAFTSPQRAARHGLAVIREPARHRGENWHAGSRGEARCESSSRRAGHRGGGQGRRPGVLLQSEQPDGDRATVTRPSPISSSRCAPRLPTP